MQYYLLKDITSLIVFGSSAIIIFIVFIAREKVLKKRLGGLITSFTMYSRNVKLARFVLLAFLIILMMSLILVFILVNESELIVRLIGQVIFLIALNYAMLLYSKMIFCKDGFAGAGIPKTHWHEVKGVIWDRDVGQKEWGVKIFIHGMKKPYRAFFNRDKKEEIEKIINEFIIKVKS
ncbi:MAG: hypothetical protein M1419_01630 [Bacteroidetes bacterium]|nr:hypothetical protein [Bacteroidota bacterium]